jgi:acid stress chaperone HdeA
MKRSAGVLLSGLIAGLLGSSVLVGCSAPSVTGGDTKCKDFLGADQSTQTEAVSKMLKDEKGADAPSLEITGTRLSVQTWCQSAGTPDSKIKEAPHL